MATSIYVIAAMCGCWYRESGVNPGIWESLIPCAWDYEYEYTSKGGYGLGQWTNVGTSDGRLYRLHQWVNANGYTDGDGNGQLAYITTEGYWNGAYDGTGDNAQTRGSYGSLANFLNSNSTNIANLVWDFLANWEGVPGNAYSERLEWADKILTYLQAHAGESASWTSKNNYLSESQTYQNALCVYNYFSGYTPDPEPKPEGTYSITVNTEGNGTAYASATYAKPDTTITLTATPNGSDTFEGWTVESGGVIITGDSFTMPEEDVVILATFTGEKTEGAGLTVKVIGKAKAAVTQTDEDTGEETTILEVESNSEGTATGIAQGTELVLFIKSKKHYKIKKVEVTKGTITLEKTKSNTYTFTFGTSDVTIEVTIMKSFPWWMAMRPTYTLKTK